MKNSNDRKFYLLATVFSLGILAATQSGSAPTIALNSDSIPSTISISSIQDGTNINSWIFNGINQLMSQTYSYASPSTGGVIVPIMTVPLSSVSSGISSSGTTAQYIYGGADSGHNFSITLDYSLMGNTLTETASVNGSPNSPTTPFTLYQNTTPSLGGTLSGQIVNVTSGAVTQSGNGYSLTETQAPSNPSSEFNTISLGTGLGYKWGFNISEGQTGVITTTFQINCTNVDGSSTTCPTQNGNGTPTPEPGTLGLLGMALGGAVIIARRKKS